MAVLSGQFTSELPCKRRDNSHTQALPGRGQVEVFRQIAAFVGNYQSVLIGLDLISDLNHPLAVFRCVRRQFIDE